MLRHVEMEANTTRSQTASGSLTLDVRDKGAQLVEGSVAFDEVAARASHGDVFDCVAAVGVDAIKRRPAAHTTSRMHFVIEGNAAAHAVRGRVVAELVQRFVKLAAEFFRTKPRSVDEKPKTTVWLRQALAVVFAHALLTFRRLTPATCSLGRLRRVFGFAEMAFTNCFCFLRIFTTPFFVPFAVVAAPLTFALAFCFKIARTMATHIFTGFFPIRLAPTLFTSARPSFSFFGIKRHRFEYHIPKIERVVTIRISEKAR